MGSNWTPQRNFAMELAPYLYAPKATINQQQQQQKKNILSKRALKAHNINMFLKYSITPHNVWILHYILFASQYTFYSYLTHFIII